jgi:aspartyl-tRNA(Asn)/glutamyl-tRNA(Gln) amidotransferase subunit B
VAFGCDPNLTLKRLTNEAANDIEAARNLNPEELAKLIVLETQNKISTTQSKAILSKMLEDTRKSVDVIISELNIASFDESETEKLIDRLISEKPEEFERLKQGDDKVIQFFIGQVMRLSKGQANGKVVTQILLSRREG